MKLPPNARGKSVLPKLRELQISTGRACLNNTIPVSKFLLHEAIVMRHDGNMISIAPNPEFEQRLAVLAKSRGQSEADLARELIEASIEELDDIQMAEPDNRNSSYNSMQLKIQQRFGGGAQVLASYSIAKLISNTNSEINWLEAASPGWGDANAYNLHGERSLDGFDVPQRLVIGSILDLPFGHGKKYASSVNGLTDKLIGGWGVNTIITFQSGLRSCLAMRS